MPVGLRGRARARARVSVRVRGPACVSGQPTAVAVPLKALSTKRTPVTLTCTPRSRQWLCGVSSIWVEPSAAESSPLW